MRKRNKIIFLILLALSLVFFGLFFYIERVDAQGIVPCGTEMDAQGRILNPCTICDFFVLIQRAINFILTRILFPIAAIMLMVGGFYLLTSRGNEEAVKKGKKILTSAVVGIIIVYAAWLIVNTVLTVVGFRLPYQNVRPLPSWNVLPTICPRPPAAPAPAPTPQPTPPPTTTLPPGVLEVPPTRFSTNGDCRDANGSTVSAQTNFAEINSSRPLTVCQDGCRPTSGPTCRQGIDANGNIVTINPNIIATINELNRNPNFNFVVTSIATGDHTSNTSQHYQGNAIDLQPVLPNNANAQFRQDRYAELLETINNPNNPYRERVERVACENSSGNTISNCGAGTNHIHITFQRPQI